VGRERGSEGGGALIRPLSLVDELVFHGFINVSSMKRLGGGGGWNGEKRSLLV